MISLVILLWACGWVVTLALCAKNYRSITLTGLLGTGLFMPLILFCVLFEQADNLVVWEESK